MKDQFLFVYSLLVIHTQQVFYSHKKPTIRERMNLQLVGNIIIVLTWIYILYILYILYISYQSIQFNPNTNPSDSNQTNSIHQYPISNIQIPCGRSIHDTNHILTSSIVILFHQISIHQFNSIQFNPNTSASNNSNFQIINMYNMYIICIICIICIIIQDTTMVQEEWR